MTMSRPLANRLTLACTGVLVLGLSACSKPEAKEAENTEPAAEDAPLVMQETLPDVVSFNAHIRPIFSDTCFACHGFDANTREADFRLDTPEGAYAKIARCVNVSDSELEASILRLQGSK